MNYLERLNHLVDSKIVAILRLENTENVKSAVAAMVKGGIKSLEIAVKDISSIEAIREISLLYSQEKLLIGAGTVLDETTCRLAVLNGASFIVTPSFSQEVIKTANRYQRPTISGALTPTEIVNSLELGVNLIKIFPGSLGGVSYLKSIRAPLPEPMYVPTGGVSRENIAEWFKAGATAVAISGEFSKLAEKGEFEQLELVVRSYFEEIEGL